MKMDTNPDSSIKESPWPDIKDNLPASKEICFDDNFTQQSNEHDLNQNGLQLPDSKQYLSILERKLNRKFTNPKKELSNREFVQSLTTKRDALFQQELEILSNRELDESLETTGRAQTISSLITNTALFSALEKKVSPQTQALDPQELQKLLDADLLNLIRDLDSSKSESHEDINEKK